MHTTVLFISLIVALFVLTRKNTKESFKGFKKYGNSNFRGGDMSQSDVGKQKECAEKCTAAEPKCKAFTVTNKKKKNGKYICWLKDETAITGMNRNEDQDKTTYISKGHYDYWAKDGKIFSKDEQKRRKEGPAPEPEEDKEMTLDDIFGGEDQLIGPAAGMS